jgi:hypothetical protein
MFGIKIENFVGLWYIADMAIGWIIHAMLKRGWTREKEKDDVIQDKRRDKLAYH